MSTFEIETARERRQDVAHVREHERVLRHVRAAHVLGQAGRRRLRADELVGRLRAVAHRQRPVRVQLAGLADAGDEVVDRDLAQRFARARAFRMSRCSRPPLARLTRATGSPSQKCTISSTSMLV